MISQPYQITRINRMGKPYVQASDPSLETEMAVNDMWLNPSAGTIKLWDGTGWNPDKGGEHLLCNPVRVRQL